MKADTARVTPNQKLRPLHRKKEGNSRGTVHSSLFANLASRNQLNCLSCQLQNSVSDTVSMTDVFGKVIRGTLLGKLFKVQVCHILVNIS